MTQTKKDEGNLAKGLMVGAAVLTGVVATLALKDKKTRKKVGQSLKELGKKGMELKEKAEKWADKKADKVIAAQ